MNAGWWTVVRVHFGMFTSPYYCCDYNTSNIETFHVFSLQTSKRCCFPLYCPDSHPLPLFSGVPVGKKREKRERKFAECSRKKQKLSYWKFLFCSCLISKNRLNQTKNIYSSSTHSLRIKHAYTVFDVLHLLLSFKLSPTNVQLLFFLLKHVIITAQTHDVWQQLRV